MSWALPCMAGAGQALSSSQDMAKFLTGMLKGLSKKPESILESVMHLSTQEYTSDRALGWFKTRNEYGTGYWHSGRTGAFSSYVAFYPATKLAVVLLANEASDNVTSAGQKVLQRFLESKVRQPIAP